MRVHWLLSVLAVELWLLKRP